MAVSRFLFGKRTSILGALALLALLQVSGVLWGQPAQRKQSPPLAVEQKADLRRDVAHEQSRRDDDQGKSPNERRLSPEQRAELRRQLREQAREPSREQAREMATQPSKKP